MSQSSSGRDDAWLAVLFRRHGGAIRAYALRRVPPDAVDDIVNEVFAVAWKHRDKVPENELPWLYRTAVHVTMHELRSRRRWARLKDRVLRLDPPDQQQPDLAVAAADRLDGVALVHHVLSMLNTPDAEVLRLWAWEQLSPQEIADALGCSAAAARVRLHRAKRRAQQVLDVYDSHVPSRVIPLDRQREY